MSNIYTDYVIKIAIAFEKYAFEKTFEQITQIELGKFSIGKSFYNSYSNRDISFRFIVRDPRPHHESYSCQLTFTFLANRWK